MPLEAQLKFFKRKYFETLAANSKLAGNLAYYKWLDEQGRVTHNTPSGKIENKL